MASGELRAAAGSLRDIWEQVNGMRERGLITQIQSASILSPLQAAISSADKAAELLELSAPAPSPEPDVPLGETVLLQEDDRSGEDEET